MSVAVFVLALLFAPEPRPDPVAPAAPGRAGTLFGWVRAEGSMEPVPFASVEAVGRRTVLTDEHGYYVMPGLDPGSVTIRAGMLGYEQADTTVVIPDGASVRVDLILATRPIRIEGIRVGADAEDIEAVTAAGPQPIRIDAPTLDIVPALAEKDAFRAIQMLPSVAAASDFSSALYIRGGSPDQTLVLLDGAPLFNPYHLAGIFSAIDPDAIATLEVMPGAMPAAEGDRASGVVKVWTRDGGRDRLRGHGAIGLVSSRLGLDGPLPFEGGSYLVSARRTYFDLMTKGAYELGWLETPFPYSFTDIHGKITQDVGRTGRLNVSGYINDERVHTPREVEPNDRSSFAWGTRAGSVSYRQPLSAALLADVTIAGTSFDGDFDAYTVDGAQQDTSFYGRMTMRDLVADVGLTWYAAQHHLRAGVQLDDYTFRYRFRLDDDIVVDPNDGDGDDIDDLFSALGRAEGITTLAAYLEDEWSIRERLSLRIGIRALHGEGLGTDIMPRIGLRWAASDRVGLTLGAGRYAQAIHSLRDEESAFASIIPYELLVPASEETGFLVSEDVVAGIEYRAPDTRLRVDGYYKRYPSLPTPPLTGDPVEAPVFATEFRRGSGWATGLEVFAQHRRGRSTFIASYALNWSERELEEDAYTPRYNRRHMLDLTGGLEVGEDGLLTARLAAGTGQSYTPALARLDPFVWNPATGEYERNIGGRIVLGEHNSRRLPAYLRLDVGYRTEWQKTWFGREVTLEPYAQVLNVLGNRNVTTGQPQYRYDGQAELEYLPALPMLPTFGIEWRF